MGAIVTDAEPALFGKTPRMSPMLCAALILGSQDKPDRSGEALLKSLFVSAGAVKNVTADIAHTSRENANSAFMADRTTSLWYEQGQKFRIQVASYWGDGRLFIADGKTLAIDPLDDGQPIILRNVGVDFMASSSEFVPKAGVGMMTLYFLMGQRGFDQLVDPNGEIVEVKRRQGHAVLFKSKGNGTVRVFWDKDLPDRIEFDNKPAMEAAYRLNPLWNAPVEDPLNVEDITWRRGAKFDKWVFDTSPGKDRMVTDERNKGS